MVKYNGDSFQNISAFGNVIGKSVMACFQSHWPMIPFLWYSTL